MALLQEDDKVLCLETRDVSPAHFLIKISSFSKLSEYGIKEYETREFAAGGYKWRLVIYPDGRHNEGSHVSVYLAMVDTSSLPLDWEVNAIFSIFLYNQIQDNYLCFRGKVERFHTLRSRSGFAKLMSKQSLADQSKGYLVDDNCVFGAEVFVLKSQRVFESLSLLQVESPHKREWKISEFSKLKTVIWCSGEFKAGEYMWTVTLHANGINYERGRSISIFLECCDSKSFASHEKVKADFCIRIKDRAVQLSHWFSSSKSDWGIHKFLPIADMQDPRKGYVVDDCCCLEIKISVQAAVRDAHNHNQ